MLDTPESIAGFGSYQSAGGFKMPSSYGLATNNQNAAQSLSAALMGSVDSELNYTKDGIQDLPATITTLAGECDTVPPACQAWKDYLDAAAKPDDLMQVSVGVDVLRKLASQPNDKPADSIKPITDGQPVDDNKQAIAQLERERAGVVSLMVQINAAITPPVSTGPTGEETTLPPPPLPDDLKQQALAMVKQLRPLVGTVKATSNTIASWASSASSERSKALKAFSDAVSFTILDGNKENPVIKDAINAINPT